MKLWISVLGLLMWTNAYADERADEILRRTRFAVTMQSDQSLHGVMTKNGKHTPIGLYLRQSDIQFKYELAGEEKRFHMRLKDDDFSLYHLEGDKVKPFSDSQISDSINGTDFTYEDLSMRFLYWSDAAVEGDEKVHGQLCTKLRLINPSKTSGQYRIVYIWVHKKFGSLMKMVGYNAAGKPLKQFQVTDVMQVGKNYTLRKMRVDTIDPKSNKAVGITYLEFEKEKRKKSRFRR